jgi:hydroxylamine reductase (hybrid-cluster protein)
MGEVDKKSIDRATQIMIEKAIVDGCETIFDRAEAMKPCPIGAEGSYCKNCGMGDDISDLPAAGAAPEWMSEKAISIGQYFVASGVYTVFGATWPTLGSEEVTKMLFEGFDGIFKGKWAFEPDPIKAAKMMIDHIDKKRKALGIDKARERILFDMAKRRELEAA